MAKRNARLARIAVISFLMDATKVQATKPCLLAINDGPHAFSWILFYLGERPYRGRFRGKAAGQRMMARQREPRRAFQDFGRDGRFGHGTRLQDLGEAERSARDRGAFI